MRGADWKNSVDSWGIWFCSDSSRRSVRKERKIGAFLRGANPSSQAAPAFGWRPQRVADRKGCTACAVEMIFIDARR